MNGSFGNYFRISENGGQYYVFFFNRIESNTIEHIKYTPQEFDFTLDFISASLSIPLQMFYTDSLDDSIQVQGQFNFQKIELFRNEETQIALLPTYNSYLYPSFLNFKNDTKVCFDILAGPHQGNWCGDYTIWGDNNLRIEVSDGPGWSFDYEIENDSLILTMFEICHNSGLKYEDILWLSENSNAMSYCEQNWFYYVSN